MIKKMVEEIGESLFYAAVGGGIGFMIYSVLSAVSGY